MSSVVFPHKNLKSQDRTLCCFIYDIFNFKPLQVFSPCVASGGRCITKSCVYPTARIPNSNCCCGSSVRPSQKPSHGDISGTKCAIIDPLVSKWSETILNKKIKQQRYPCFTLFLKEMPHFTKKKNPIFTGHDLKQAWRTGLSGRRARRTKSRGRKGLQLEVGAQRAPRPIVPKNEFSGAHS